MRIDGFGKTNFEHEIENTKTTGTFNASALSDVVTIGSVTDFFGKEPEKNSLLVGDGTLEGMKEQATVLKDNMTALFDKMDTGSVTELNGESVDLYEEDTDELVTVVEKIQIMLATYCDDFEPTVNLSREDVKKVMGAVAMLEDVKDITDADKAYLLQNKMEPTISNIYIAKHAGFVCGRNAITDKEWDEMYAQAEKILVNAGYEPTKDNMDMCRFMIDNEIDLCKDSFDRMESMADLEPMLNRDTLIRRAAANIIEGRSAKDTRLDEKKCPWESARDVVKTVNAATEGNIMAWSVRSESLTIASLREVEDDGLEILPDRANVKFVTAQRRLTEVRLMMTLEAARAMEKNGIRVDYLEISDLLDQLKAEEAKEWDAKSIDIEQTQMVLTSVESLRTVHCAVIGSVIEAREIPTINSLQFHATGIEAKMAAAQNSYEALSTEIRGDLGDSVNRAIKESMGDILEDMGYERNEENERAIRILVYNDMEVTEQALNQVKNIDYCVNQLFGNMTPKNVLSMIRDGVNPLETDVTELSNYLANMSVTAEYEAEKYSEFVYRMDKKGEFTPEEREKFLSIYSLVRKFEKDGMNAIGALINQGLELTMGNLLTAYMTRQGRNMNLEADVDTGLSEVKDKVSYYKSLFANAKKHVTPEALAEIGEDFDDMNPEELAKKLLEDESYRDEVAAEKQLNDLHEACRAGDAVFRFVTYNEVPQTIANILGAKALLRSPQDVFNEDVKDEAEAILDSLTDKETAQKEYDKLLGNAKELIKSERVDIEALRRVGMGINLVNTMAHRNNYVIPYEKDNQMGIINLKILETGENRGSFMIKMQEITVEGKVTEDGISARIMSRSLEVVSTGVVEGIRGELQKIGFSDIRIDVNKAKDQPDMKSGVMEGVSSRRIFAAAKIFIQQIANI